LSELSYEQRHPDVIEPSLERRSIDITWLDGHRSSYDFEYLRWQCPCAICRGEGGSPGVLATTQSLTAEETTLVDLGPVGNYAMGLTWQDSHATGIYSWDYLRRICPCAECARQRGTSGKAVTR
jgi:DUF971 family protein